LDNELLARLTPLVEAHEAELAAGLSADKKKSLGAVGENRAGLELEAGPITRLRLDLPRRGAVLSTPDGHRGIGP